MGIARGNIGYYTIHKVATLSLIIVYSNVITLELLKTTKLTVTANECQHQFKNSKTYASLGFKARLSLLTNVIFSSLDVIHVISDS